MTNRRNAVLQLSTDEQIERVRHAIRHIDAAMARVDVRDGDRPNLEANPTLHPEGLVGFSPYAMGALQQARWGDPLLAPALERLRDRVISLGARLEPPELATTAEQAVFIRLQHAFRDMRGGPDVTIATIVDEVLYAGRHVSEARAELSHRSVEPRFRLFALAPHSVRFEANWPRNPDRIKQIHQIGAVGPITNFFYFGRQRAPGDFEGWARVTRPSLGLSLIREALVKQYLLIARTMKGVPIVQTTQPDTSLGNQSAAIADWIDAWADDDPVGLELPYGREAVPFSPHGQLPDITGMLRYIDELMRWYTLDSLSSLGVSQTGSRALGEEFHDADADGFASFVRSLLPTLNGAEEEYSDLLYAIASTLRISMPSGCRWPTIVFDRLSSIPVSRQLSLISEAKKNGIELDLGRDDIDRIRRGIGLSAAEIEDEEDPTQTETRVDRDLLVLRDANAGVITPEQAAQVLQRNGWSLDEAQALLGMGSAESARMDEAVASYRHKHGPGCGASCGHTSIVAAARRGPLAQPGDIADYDAIEALLDRAQARAARRIREVSRVQRAAWVDAGITSTSQVVTFAPDFTNQYASVLLEEMGDVAGRGATMAVEELRATGHRPASTAPGEEQIARMRGLALIRAKQLSETANEELRSAAYGVLEQGALPSTLSQWALPETTAATVSGSSISLAFAESQEFVFADEAASRRALWEGARFTDDTITLPDGTEISQLEDGQWVETTPDGETIPHRFRPVGTSFVRQDTRLDRSVCDECLALHGDVMQVGSQRQMDAMPPYHRCKSALNLQRGNLCRCKQESMPSYTPADLATWERDRRETDDRRADFLMEDT